MIKNVHEYWQKNYAQSSLSTAKPKAVDDNDRSPLDMQLGDVSEQPKSHDDPFLNYIYQPPTGSVDVLNWFAEYGPIELRQMAFDLYLIPAMSAEVERVFSSSKRAPTPDRNTLTVESLEAYELLRNWWQGDIVLQLSGTNEEEEQHLDD
jgi:hypothetical protein